MSFAAPLVLLGLLGLPVLAGLYLVEQRQRRTAAAAFASPAMQLSVAPRRPGWRRHVPMLAVLLAMALLILAVARPQRTVAVPVEHASIMLATDVSGSMRATDVKPNRLAAAKEAAHRFVDRVPSRVNIGVMAFNRSAGVLQSPTRDRQAVAAAIEGMKVGGTTATGTAIYTATKLLQRAPGVNGKRPPAAIVLLSDGKSTRGPDPVPAARAAGKLHIPVYTVALGTPDGTLTIRTPGGGTRIEHVPPDPQALGEIARASGGTAFTAQTAAGLKQVYERLGSQLGHRKEKHQITTAFAGGAAVLLLAGIGASLAWFGRLI